MELKITPNLWFDMGKAEEAAMTASSAIFFANSSRFASASVTLN